MGKREAERSKGRGQSIAGRAGKQKTMAWGQSQSRRAGEEIKLDCSSLWPWELEKALGGKSKTDTRKEEWAGGQQSQLCLPKNVASGIRCNRELTASVRVFLLYGMHTETSFPEPSAGGIAQWKGI